MSDTISSGIDVGASSIKVAITRTDTSNNEELLATEYQRIRKREPKRVLESVYGAALDKAGLKKEEIVYTASTGEGEVVEFRRGHFYGMTTHARGALFLCPEARSALDIGSLHARAIRMSELGRVLDYRMTSQCASGSGQFLENISRYLGVTLEEIGELSKTSGDPEKISSICAVLAETDVINMVSRGISTPDILRGIHDSMARRFVKLLKSSKAKGKVAITGGLAADQGLIAAIEHAVVKAKLDLSPITHPKAIYAGAIGAALWGGLRYRKLSES